MNRFYKHGLEAIPREARKPDGPWQVRPIHPDGFGYATITHTIDKDLAQQWAAVGNLSRNDWELIAAGLQLLPTADEKMRARALELAAWARAQGWEPDA